MARRASLSPKEPLNRLGPTLRSRIAQKDLIARLGIQGWLVQPSVITGIEQGIRSLTDTELLMILAALRKSLTDLDRALAERKSDR